MPFEDVITINGERIELGSFRETTYSGGSEQYPGSGEIAISMTLKYQPHGLGQPFNLLGEAISSSGHWSFLQEDEVGFTVAKHSGNRASLISRDSVRRFSRCGVRDGEYFRQVQLGDDIAIVQTFPRNQTHSVRRSRHFPLGWQLEVSGSSISHALDDHLAGEPASDVWRGVISDLEQVPFVWESGEPPNTLGIDSMDQVRLHGLINREVTLINALASTMLNWRTIDRSGPTRKNIRELKVERLINLWAVPKPEDLTFEHKTLTPAILSKFMGVAEFTADQLQTSCDEAAEELLEIFDGIVDQHQQEILDLIGIGVTGSEKELFKRSVPSKTTIGQLAQIVDQHSEQIYRFLDRYQNSVGMLPLTFSRSLATLLEERSELAPLKSAGFTYLQPFGLKVRHFTNTDIDLDTSVNWSDNPFADEAFFVPLGTAPRLPTPVKHVIANRHPANKPMRTDRMPPDGRDVISRFENDQDRLVEQVLPPVGPDNQNPRDEFVNGLPIPRESISLLQLVRIWLRHLGLANTIEAESTDYGDVRLKVQIAGDSGWSALEHVGTGVSVVLPILYSCLTSEPNDILIIEEPEAHLHPRAQEAIADLLASYANANRQVFVETHSELVVNRIRVLVAEGHLPSIRNETKILMVSKTDQTDSNWQQTVYTENRVMEDGSFEKGWIDEFLGVGARQYETLLRHSMGMPASKD